MEFETQTSRRLALTSLPPAHSPSTRPGSPTPSSPGNRSNFFGTIMLSRSKNSKLISSDKAQRKYGHLTWEEVVKLPPDTIRTIPSEHLNGCPRELLGSLPDDVLARLSPGSLARASTGVLLKLPIQTLAVLPLQKLQNLNQGKLVLMKPRWLADFLRHFPETIQGLMSNTAILDRLSLLPPEEFIMLPHQVLEKVSSEFFQQMPPSVWDPLPLHILRSFPENMKAAYANAVSIRMDQQGVDGNADHHARSHILDGTLQSSGTPLNWPLETPPHRSQTALSYLPPVAPIGSFAPFPSSTFKPEPPLPSNVADIKADIVHSVNGIRLEDWKGERDQLKAELKADREKLEILNRQLGQLESKTAELETKTAGLESAKSQLELEKRKTSEAIRRHLSDKSLGNINRGQGEIQLLLDFNQNQHEYVLDLQEKNALWEGDNQRLRAEWVDIDRQRQQALVRVDDVEQENLRIKQEIRDQQATRQLVEGQRLEIERLKTILARADANTATKLNKQHEELTNHYISKQSALDEELRLARQDKFKLEKAFDKLDEQRQNEQEALIRQHEARLQSQEADFALQYNNLSQHLHDDYQSQVSEELERRDEAHQRHISELLERIKSLESSLVDNSDDFRPATDDSLKNKYQSLKLTIDTITFNLGAITFPPGSRLDQGRFMEREGEGVYLLQSIIWERLQHGFFSLPFGLGALGPGEGKKRLLEMYVAYRRLAGVELPGAVPQLVEQECVQVFRTDKEANKWRSSTFQTIGTTVISKRGKEGSEIDNETHIPYFKNRQQVLQSIKAVLGEVCAGVSKDMEKKVIDLVHMAGELSLEFGAQRAELGFESPPRDSSIQIGRGFVDCIDDDKCKDQFKTVALAVSPKFYKTGDGRHDLTTTKLISQGTIFSART